MFVYARLTDYKRMKDITTTLSTEEARLLRDQLKRASRYIDRVARRWFYPRYAVRRMDVPVNYQDLANRVKAEDDLWLDQDLLESTRLQTDTGALIDTLETVEAGGITATLTVLTVSDADGVDAKGNARFTIGDVLRIDDEQLWVRYVDTDLDKVTVARGQFGTQASLHSAATTINKMSSVNMVPGIDFQLLEYNQTPFWAIRLIWPNWWTGGFVSTRGRFPQPQIYIEGWWGYHNDVENMYIDTLETVEAGGITATLTVLTVSDAAGVDAWNELRFEVDDFIRVDNEFMWITAVDTGTNKLTVIRGQNGTLAVAHDEAVVIFRFAVDELVKGMALTIAKTWRESDESTGGRQGVSEMSAGVELGLPKDVVQQVKLLRRGFIG